MQTAIVYDADGFINPRIAHVASNYRNEAWPGCNRVLSIDPAPADRVMTREFSEVSSSMPALTHGGLIRDHRDRWQASNASDHVFTYGQKFTSRVVL
jgi:hypothetical protein